MAIKASQTGHLVLSTLHTQDAPSALVRLRNMGIATYNLASSISLISAQRLVRRLCTHCKVPIMVSSTLLKDLGWQAQHVHTEKPRQFYSAQGCTQCHKGYWGRIGIFQLMPISPVIQHLILQDASRSALAAQADKEGVMSLRHGGLLQAALGITSISEVLAHTDVH
jgi:type IV pilus assembly protein PilB